MKAPSLLDKQPFLLPGHSAVGPRFAKDLIEWGGVIVEESPRIPNTVIIRKSWANPFIYKLKSAEPPSIDEAFALWSHGSEEVSKIAHSNNVVWLRRLAHWSTGRLATLAREGNGKALWHFVEGVCASVEGLSQITRANPKVLAPLARGRIRWPMMRSTHPLNCDPDRFLDDIQLAADVPLQTDKFSKWKPDFAAQYAINLYEHINALRADDSDVWIIQNRKRKHFKDLLPKFTKDTAETWWGIAEKFLLHSYPRPEKVAEFVKIVTAPTKKKSPGRMKQSILEKIKARFFALAK